MLVVLFAFDTWIQHQLLKRRVKIRAFIHKDMPRRENCECLLRKSTLDWWGELVSRRATTLNLGG